MATLPDEDGVDVLTIARIQAFTQGVKWPADRNRDSREGP
jgi:hypothetical protein